MKKLLILGAAVLGLCTLGQTARAGDDGPVYNNDRPAPQYSQAPAPCARVYLPPPPLVFLPPLPFVSFYGGPRFHRHYGPYAYGYGYRGCGYGYRPGVHIGVGF